MAVEQDWAAYGDQAFLATTDTLLVRTAAGAGAEVPGTHVMARRTAGGVYIANGAGAFVTAGATFNITPDASSGANGVALEASFAAGGYGPLRFLTAGAERARITPAGEFLVGTTSAAGLYNGSSVRQGTNIDPGGTLSIQKSNGSTVWLAKASGYTDNNFVMFGVNGTGVGSITTTGSATAYNTSSDHRLKDDYQPLTGALDRILALPVYDFRWIASGDRARGFKAHEYGEVIPGAATGQKDGMREEEYEIEPARASDVLGPDGTPVMIPAVMGKRMVPDYQGIDQSKAVPDLVGAVQEMAAIIEDLRARLDVLEAA